MIMRKVLLSMMLCCFASMMYAQSFDQERIALSKFIERMYNSSPFEGCRIVDDYDNSYLLSVVPGGSFLQDKSFLPCLSPFRPVGHLGDTTR